MGTKKARSNNRIIYFETLMHKLPSSLFVRITYHLRDSRPVNAVSYTHLCCSYVRTFNGRLTDDLVDRDLLRERPVNSKGNLKGGNRGVRI